MNAEVTAVIAKPTAKSRWPALSTQASATATTSWRWLDNSDGSLDTTFGTGGTETITNNDLFTAVPNSLAQTADGGYVVVGSFLGQDFAGSSWPLVRLNPDGSLDTAFGNGGFPSASLTTPQYDSINATSVLVQSDQKIVVAAAADTIFDNTWSLVRYNPDGTLDTSFGSSGIATITWAADRQTPLDVVEQADGKLLIAGQTPEQQNGPADGFELVRLTSSGAIDPTFNGGQPIATGVAGSDVAASYSVAVQANGKILLAGGIHNLDKFWDNFGILRFNSDGSLDTTFGNDGLASTSFDEESMGVWQEYDNVTMGLSPNGSIVVTAQGSTQINDEPSAFMTARFTGDPPPPTTPTVTVSDTGGAYTGNPYPATALVDGAANLEGVTPTLAITPAAAPRARPAPSPPARPARTRWSPTSPASRLHSRIQHPARRSPSLRPP